ncbi:hypothetical protein MIMGU_mgv1a018112mg [Erythranthe guttata]|uniref:Subtilisin-like protease fibronectin type-III domain-containing protein n=1 Tax=Erythranthe guttata TaxID=4155 RepID=A0A022RRV3_ERYGU|nr:hypothetical protein MIMGU_mgv1a018112mg [Erythranthe guttata]
MALITSPKAEFGITPAPLMASFSSRGPNTATPGNPQASTVDNTNKPMLEESSLVEATPFSSGAGHIKKLIQNNGCLLANTFSLLDFNYPSITVPKLSSSVKVNRILKNVGSPGIYFARIRPPLGVSVSVEPNTLEFTKNGEEMRFQLTMTRDTTNVQSKYSFGELLWSDGKHNVR